MIRIIYQENGEQKDVTDKVIVGHAQVIELKENNMEDKNKTVAELIADLQNQLDRANNRIEGLVKKNDELKEIINAQYGLYNTFYNNARQDALNENNRIKKEIKKLKNKNEYLLYENDNLDKEITKWHNKYTKEKAKHDKATKKIDELKNHQKDKLAYLKMESEKNNEIDKLIESLQKQLIQKKNEYAELYDELKYDEKLIEIANTNYVTEAVKRFIGTYEMLKNDYLKGHITEDIFLDEMDSNVNHMKEIMKTGGAK